VLPPLEIPSPYRGRLRVGTCSWKYDSWQDLIYRPGVDYGPNDYLPDYARYYNTVEIDQWFWSLFPKGAKLPDPTTVEAYATRVSDDFRFTVKAPNAITLTHYYARQPATSAAYANRPNPSFLDPALLRRFLDILSPMRRKLGPVMLQFEYLNKQKMPSLRAFLDALAVFFDHVPAGYDYAIEIRNPNYLRDELFAFLRERRLGFVLLEGYYMPPIAEVATRFDVRTAPYSIVRLHGPDRQKIEEQTRGRWDRIVAPKEASLDATARIIQDAVQVDITMIANVNNHYEGCAPLTIQRLIERLQRR
jgi:uncharacterized protein YecE (DUF72 family)